MAKKSIYKRNKELTPKESIEMVKSLLKRKRPIKWNKMKPGHLFFTSYNAKDKEQTYDRTPLVMMFWRNGKYTLGLNFHWLPISMRLNLIKHIININKMRIKHRKSLIFSYKQLKPMLKSLGYAPCIRLYINRRFGRSGVIIPPYMLEEMGRVRSETFTNGKYSASELYRMAKNRNRKKTKRKK